MMLWFCTLLCLVSMAIPVLATIAMYDEMHVLREGGFISLSSYAQCISERMQNRRLRNGQTFTGARAFSRQKCFVQFFIQNCTLRMYCYIGLACPSTIFQNTIISSMEALYSAEFCCLATKTLRSGTVYRFVYVTGRNRRSLRKKQTNQHTERSQTAMNTT